MSRLLHPPGSAPWAGNPRPGSPPWVRRPQTRANGRGLQDTWSHADATERSRDLLPWMGGQSVQG